MHFQTKTYPCYFKTLSQTKKAKKKKEKNHVETYFLQYKKRICHNKRVLLLYKKNILHIEREITMKLYKSFSEKDTKKIGFLLAEQAKAGEINCLQGELGAGKTIFAKGFAQGLGINPEDVTSPTFTIVNEYQGKLPFYHFDVYRIASLEGMEDTGYEDYFFGQGVCLVEWAELIEELLPQQVIWIKIQKEEKEGKDYRNIMVEGGTL